nr:NUMOD4 domain-containing protein [Chryseolinea lacunae]
MPGEKWKPIPEFESLYEISNYGRVKSLSREMMLNSPGGGSYMSKEKIRRAKVDVKINKTTKQNIYSLGMTLYRDAIAYHYSLPRLTYYVFKGKFNLDHSTELISFKDHDGRNTHISNLVKTTISQIKLASYKEKRAISHLSVLSKPVTQFDGQGKVIAHFPSMYEAGRLTGFNGRNIAEVVSGQGHMFKGYFWRAGIHHRNLSLTKIRRNTERGEINTALAKRLKIRYTDKSKIPAIVNLSLASMAGEKWKAAPGYQGLYLVSNYGRVKALGKITQGLQQKWMPEQIQKIIVDFRKDRKGKWVAGSTFASMAVEGRKKQVSIPRLVYFLFVKRYDIADTNLRVYYKDGNPPLTSIWRGVFLLLV